MSLAFEHLILDDDVLLIESDLVCEVAILERIVHSPHANAALVDHYRTGMDGTVVTVAGGIITSVIPPHLQTGEFSFTDKYKTLNIYRFSKASCVGPRSRSSSPVMRTIDENCYYELILGIPDLPQEGDDLCRDHRESEKWAEIDDPNDLRIAEFTFSPASSVGSSIYLRRAATWSYDIVDFLFHPQHVLSHAVDEMAEIRLRPTCRACSIIYGSKQEVPVNKKLATFLLCAPERVNVLNGVSTCQILSAPGRAARRQAWVLMPEADLRRDTAGAFLTGATYSDPDPASISSWTSSGAPTPRAA